MLQNIRDGAQGWLAWVIVGVISVPFAFWGINEYFSPSPKTIIAEVNGVELSGEDFRQQVSQRKQQLRTMYRNMDLSFMDEQIRQDTLKQMIEEEVLVQSAKDAGMRIGDALLVTRIHSIPAFHDDEGKFSQKQYEQTLRFRAGLSPTYFEYTMRRQMLTNQLREGVLRSTFLTDYDRQQRIRLEKQQRFISYVIIPTSRFNDSVTITDAEIEAHYKDNASQYMTDEKVSIEYVELSRADISTESLDEETLKAFYEERKVSFTTQVEWKARHILIKAGKNATPEVLEAAQKKAREVLDKIRAGGSFEELAKQFSDDGSKESGGDLGWFGSGMMVKPFEDVVKNLKVGEVSEPVKTRYGFHIIELLEIKPEKVRPFVEVRTQLEKDIQKEQAGIKFEGQAEQFSNLAFENPNSLEVLAETLKLKSKSTGLFDRTGGDQKVQHPILSHNQVIEAAFSDDVLKESYNSEPIQIEEQHAVILRLKNYEPAKAKPLEEVKEEIISAIRRDKTKASAQGLGKSLLEQMRQIRSREALVKTHNLSWSQARWIERQDSTLGQPAIVREVFKMGRPEGEAIYQDLQLNNGDYALVAVLEVKDGVVPPEPENKEATEDDSQDDDEQNTKKQQERALGTSEYDRLVSGLKAGAEIEKFLKKPSES